MWTFHLSLPYFIDQYVTKGLQSLQHSKCTSLCCNYWDLKRLEKFASDVDRCLNLLARCWYTRCVGLLFIIFLQRMWEGSNTTLFLVLLPQSGTQCLYQDWQCKTRVYISFSFCLQVLFSSIDCVSKLAASMNIFSSLLLYSYILTSPRPPQFWAALFLHTEGFGLQTAVWLF